MNFTGITFIEAARSRHVWWKVVGIDERIRLVREAVGDRLGRLELSAQIQRVIVTDHRRHAAEELRRRGRS